MEKLRDAGKRTKYKEYTEKEDTKKHLGKITKSLENTELRKHD